MIRYCKVDGIEGVCIFHHVVVSHSLDFGYYDRDGGSERYFLTEDIMVVVEEPCGGLSCVELGEVKMLPPNASATTKWAGQDPRYLDKPIISNIVENPWRIDIPPVGVDLEVQYEGANGITLIAMRKSDGTKWIGSDGYELATPMLNPRWRKPI